MSKPYRYLLGFFAIALLPSCVSVGPGRGAVSMDTSGGKSSLVEGADFVSPFSTLDYYDLRQQGYTERFVAVTADGAPIEASDSLVTFHIVPNELIDLDHEVGPDYRRVVVEPIIKSAVRRMLAAYRWDQMDTDHLIEAQDKITRFAAERLRPFHIVLESILLRNVQVTLPLFQDAVNDTAVWEQKSLEAKSKLELAQNEAQRKRIEAEGVASVHRLVGKTLTSPVLADDETKVWEKLISSPTSKVEVVNDNNSEVEVEP